MGVRGASDIDGLGACRTNASLFTTIAHTNGMVDSGKVEWSVKTCAPCETERMKVIAVIPARLASTRLPRKMLREIAGVPLLAWVYRGVRRCSSLDQVIVATDSDEIMRFCEAARLCRAHDFGGASVGHRAGA